MTIESICPGCGRKLRVADEHLGSMARCPACNKIFQVGQKPEQPQQPEPPQQPVAQWRMRTPEGQVYGPVTREHLDRWVAEGRVSADCWLSVAEASWQPAATYYPGLQPIASVSPYPQPVVSGMPPSGTSTTANPFRDEAYSRENPYEAARTPGGSYRYTAPHRGVLILILGILSWVIGCFPLGIAAWAMGSNDLAEMRRGRMDPSGQGLTRAGQVIGIIHVVLTVAGIMLMFLVTMLAIVAD